MEIRTELGLALAFALMLAGLMSKAILIVLPPILLRLDFWPLRRVREVVCVCGGPGRGTLGSGFC